MTSVIPNYALYGETAQPSWQSTFDFEWIPARSRPHHWKIRPHKHDSFIQILYLTQGSGEALVDTVRWPLAAPCLVLVPAQTVHAFTFSPNVDGPVVTAAQRTLESMASVTMPELLTSLRKPAVIALDNVAGHADVLMPLFLAIERETLRHETGQLTVGLALLTALCVQAHRLSNAATPTNAPAPSPTSSRKAQQVEKFRRLVDSNYRKHLPMADYAGHLGITPGQLSRLCRDVLGVSALDVINSRLMHEAQRELVYTTTRVKQLADALGFADDTYFGRFFRKHAGLSPREFRTKTLGTQNMD